MRHRLGGLLDRFEDVAVVVLFCAAILLYLSQVVSRYLIGFTFEWAEELIVTMVVWACFIGASIAVRRRAHISVDLLVQQLPPLAHRVAALVAIGLCTVFTFLMLWLGIAFVRFMASTGNRAESIDIPAWPLYIAVPLAGALMTIRLLQEAWHILQPGWVPESHVHAPTVEEGSA